MDNIQNAPDRVADRASASARSSLRFCSAIWRSNSACFALRDLSLVLEVVPSSVQAHKLRRSHCRAFDFFIDQLDLLVERNPLLIEVPAFVSAHSTPVVLLPAS